MSAYPPEPEYDEPLSRREEEPDYDDRVLELQYPPMTPQQLLDAYDKLNEIERTVDDPTARIRGGRPTRKDIIDDDEIKQIAANFLLVGFIMLALVSSCGIVLWLLFS